MRFPCRQLVGALVIILMALSSVAPLDYAHTHAATACHEHERPHAHGDSSAHCHRHCHRADNEPVAPAMLSPHTHRHVLWWGLEFVLPADPASDSDSLPGKVDGSQISALTAGAKTVKVDLAHSPHLLLPAIPSACGPAITTLPVARGAAPRVECNLLCDTARFERSGVQLL